MIQRYCQFTVGVFSKWILYIYSENIVNNMIQSFLTQCVKKSTEHSLYVCAISGFCWKILIVLYTLLTLVCTNPNVCLNKSNNNK